MTATGHSPIEESTTRIWQGPDALQKLNDLGIDLDAVTTCLNAGDLAARQADEFSPVTAEGTERWNHTVQELRRNLAKFGWRVRNPNNSPRIVRPDGRLAMAVVSGNKFTGIPHSSPKNAHSLGRTLDESVLRNRTKEVIGQLVLTPVEDAAIEDAVNSRRIDSTTWILMYFYDPVAGLRAEISLPRYTFEGFISDWTDRIIIPTEAPLDEMLPLSVPLEDVPFDILQA